MDTITEWLPHSPVVHRVQPRAAVRFCEFLYSRNIVFFPSDATKTQVVETLVGTLQGHDHPAVLQSIWSREREGALGIQPDISILRGRLEHIQHIRAALGLCPDGVRDPSNPCGSTRVFILFAGPTTQTRLHAGFLVAASALFHNRPVVEKILKLDSPDNVLEALQRAEGLHSSVNPVKRFSRGIFDFFRIRYGWGDTIL